MPRIRQYADRDAMKDFISEINAQRGRFGYTSQKSLADAIGVCQSTVCKYVKEPEAIPFVTLKAMIKTLKPNPVVVLKALGYTAKDINNLARERNHEQ